MRTRRMAVVILHYGDPALTSRVKDQLFEESPKWSDDIFVLDNNAPQPFPDPWQRTDKNLYWAGALDYCLRAFETQGYTHLWFLNNDIWFASKPPHIERAWQRLKRLDSLLGPVGAYSPSVTSNPYHPQMEEKPGLQYSQVPYIDGIAPLLRIDSINAIGGLDFTDNAYGYGVDVWNTLSLHRAGHPVVVDHQVTLRHAYHSTARTIDGFMTTAAKAKETYLTQRIGPNFEAKLKQELDSCRNSDSM